MAIDIHARISMDYGIWGMGYDTVRPDHIGQVSEHSFGPAFIFHLAIYTRIIG